MVEARDESVCYDDCENVEKKLILTNNEEVSFTGCPGDIIKLKISPEQEVRWKKYF